jgi:hypothetical protein
MRQPTQNALIALAKMALEPEGYAYDQYDDWHGRLRYAARVALDSTAASPPPPDLAGIRERLEWIKACSGTLIGDKAAEALALLNAGGNAESPVYDALDLPQIPILVECFEAECKNNERTDTDRRWAGWCADLAKHVARLEAQIEALKK